MTGESDNLPDGGTDNAHPLSLDDAMTLDWTDPSEDTGTEDAEEQSDEETVEADEGQETDEAADDDNAEDDGQADDESDPDEDGEDDDAGVPAAEIADDALITLPNGEALPFAELKSGYMRQSDYTRKRQEDSNRRKELETLATNVNASVEALAGLLEKSLPPMPDQALAFKDPQRHYAMKTAREQAEARLQEVLNAAHAPKEVTGKLTQDQHDELIAEESRKLAESFPETFRTKEGHKQFFDAASETARQLGYSDEEIGLATDHRLFKMAHYARLGMQAEAAKRKAKDKVRDAPPVAPARRQKTNGAGKARKNADAMRRLQKTGSIHDAMMIDFD
ncbi:hypothetical protein GCM10007989_07440 [Devosia pacifica]|uniref:Uncharacterized protein n=1 Tax=Devosia pacifica TaxID=1335967 RepID=A0A918RXV4_9HYPH|nr:hypothetical protein [Devosia pacifica]GHA15195.1 hypothetical protein GCM10007989_07440 [Devosia pacifica]